MTFVEKHRFGGGHGEQSWLRMSWEGEIFGVGMLETMAEMFPEHAHEATACATMEWVNIHRCEDFGHEADVGVTLEDAEKLGQEGARLARTHSFETLAKLTIAETPAADKMYVQLAKGASTPELKKLGEDLYDHENALRDWLKSELEGKPDGAEKVFAYLERQGISREEAVIPRKDREGYGGDTQQLVLAFFDSEDVADEAAKTLKEWENVTEYRKSRCDRRTRARQARQDQGAQAREASRQEGHGHRRRTGRGRRHPHRRPLAGRWCGRRCGRRWPDRGVLPQGPQDDQRGGCTHRSRAQ